MNVETIKTANTQEEVSFEAKASGRKHIDLEGLLVVYLVLLMAYFQLLIAL